MKEPRLLLRRRRLKRQDLNREIIILARSQKRPERILVPQRRSNNKQPDPVVRKEVMHR